MECALDLMVANCVHFNGDDSHLSKTARGIRAEFTRLREKDAAAEAMAVAAPAEQATDFMPRLRSAMTETLPPRRCVDTAPLEITMVAVFRVCKCFREHLSHGVGLDLIP